MIDSYLQSNSEVNQIRAMADVLSAFNATFHSNFATLTSLGVSHVLSVLGKACSLNNVTGGFLVEQMG
jgi:hypothetical protein